MKNSGDEREERHAKQEQHARLAERDLVRIRNTSVVRIDHRHRQEVKQYFLQVI